MNASPAARLRTLLLALLLALGTSLALVHGSVMQAEMALAAEAGHPGSGGCDGCGHDADASTCLWLCASAAQGVLPAEPVALPAAARVSFQAGHLVLGGRSHRPDPGPPKTLALG